MSAEDKSKASDPSPGPSRSELGEMAERWRAYRAIYPLYSELARRVGSPSSCSHLESPVNRSDSKVLSEIENWFVGLEQRFEAYHLRQVLQGTRLGTEEALRLLLARYLGKAGKSAGDRDKIDFLLVQYLDQCSPPNFQHGKLELEDVSAVLEPVLGEASTLQPPWLAPLEKTIAELSTCRSLSELLQRQVIERVRGMKAKAGQMYFGSSALLAFARFNFLMRRAFFRVLYEELQAIRRGVHELEKRNVRTLDCTRARLSASEPIASLLQICAGWKQPFRAPYAAGHAVQQLVEIRAAVETALQKPHAAVPNKARAAASSSGRSQ